MNTLESEDSFGLTVCHKFPVAIERGQGSVVWDVNGKAYLDFTSGWGVTSLGHAHPVVLNALNAQAARIMQNPNSGFTYSPVRARLLNRLQQVLPGDLCRVFFANSGAEANDGAVKLARKVTGRTTVIAISGSFHGRTLGTLSLSGGQENAARYLPQVPGNLFAPFGDMAALESLMSDQVAAVILEPVQGEGGVREQAAEYAQAVAALCQQYGALLIADEVQTGFCRTGSFFAVDALGIAPDILTMGKGIASGFPFAAFALTEAVAAGSQKAITVAPIAEILWAVRWRMRCWSFCWRTILPPRWRAREAFCTRVCSNCSRPIRTWSVRSEVAVCCLACRWQVMNR